MAQPDPVEIVLVRLFQAALISGQNGPEKACLMFWIQAVDGLSDLPGQNRQGIAGRDALRFCNGDVTVSLGTQVNALGGVVQAVLPAGRIRRGAVGHAGELVPWAQVRQAAVSIEEGRDLAPLPLPGLEDHTGAVVCALRPAGDDSFQLHRSVFHGLGWGDKHRAINHQPHQGDPRPCQQPPGLGPAAQATEQEADGNTDQAHRRQPDSSAQEHTRQRRQGKARREPDEGRRRHPL